MTIRSWIRGIPEPDSENARWGMAAGCPVRARGCVDQLLHWRNLDNLGHANHLQKWMACGRRRDGYWSFPPWNEWAGRPIPIREMLGV